MPVVVWWMPFENPTFPQPMERFAALFTTLDQTTKTNDKVAALAHYFADAPDEDKIWAVALLSHRRPKGIIRSAQLREWAASQANLPAWLFEDSYHVVGDLAETIALVLPPPSQRNPGSLNTRIHELVALKKEDDEVKQAYITETWDALSYTERFVFNKLLTGGFRVGISQKLMVRALAKHTGREENELAHRLMGKWDPLNISFEELLTVHDEAAERSRPYPFYLAYALDLEPASLGAVSEWQAERKWDGIRGQVIVRGGELFVWSRGEELVTEKFPEYHDFPLVLPDGTVLDGEILAFENDAPLPFNVLQTRIGRKNITKNVLAKAPVVLMAYDLLECDGEDYRSRPLSERRAKLEALVETANHSRLLLSKPVPAKDWQDLVQARAESREHHAEGLMLKRLDSVYEVGRKRGDWWKWKVDPLTIDAVMIYAMRGHGRRANLYTDYTFGVWDGELLVSFAKAYSGLTDAEIKEVDRFVKANTVERFGPVRSVKAELVMELAFEGIAASSRHKSGVALRFPRIHRWRKDKKASEANTLDDLKGLL